MGEMEVFLLSFSLELNQRRLTMDLISQQPVDVITREMIQFYKKKSFGFNNQIDDSDL